MVLKRVEWPEVDEYAVAVATKVTSYGAYVVLPEYGNKEGFIHISEISSTWVRNIRNHIHENQRVTVKVLQVDTQKKHIDCSLRRVSAEAMRVKNNEWKRAQKAEKILEQLGNENGMTLEEVYKQVGWPIEDYFGEIYKVFERMADTGEVALESLDIPKKFKTQLAELTKSRIDIPSVELDGELNVQVPTPDGIDVIKRALVDALEVAKEHKKSAVEIYTLGSPRYKLRIVSPDYKEAEEVLSAMLERITKIVQDSEGTAAFNRK